MEKDDIIYHPHKTYETDLKRQYHTAANDYFDSLVEKTETDADANKQHVSAYRNAAAILEAAKKKWRSCKLKRTLFIIAMIVLLVVGVVGFVLFAKDTSMTAFLIMGIVGVTLGPCCLIGIIAFHKKAKAAKKELEPLEKDADEKLKICQADMARLNAEFDWNMAAVVMENATPMIDLDPYFNNATLEYLMKRFAFPSAENEDTSVLGLVSGRIQGNPFVLEKILSKTMGTKTYTGSITITWTETVGSGKDRHTVTRSQVLTASVTKPCPYYQKDTRLVFGSEAAPTLSFSRAPFGADKMDEKKREKAWKSGGKKLDKKATEATKKGENFTKMNNDEFEVFWNATDRNDEVAFRYLFTPLAQTSILELIENPEPFGDDFYFVKEKMLTSVASAHSQNFDYSPDPSYFYDYCLEDCKKKFVTYCDDFIRGLYFDLAPILAIPAYQATKTRDYIYGETLEGNYNCYEHEVLANGFSNDIFRPDGASSSLPLILKAESPKKYGKADVVPIHAYSYRVVQRVDYIPRHGGDGRMHQVPVHWDEYIPVDSVSQMSAKNYDIGVKKYRNALDTLDEYLKKNEVYRRFERGFIAFASRKGSTYNPELDGKLESMFAEGE